MKKIVVLLVGVLYGLGLYAQTPDSTGVVVCEIPGVLDTLRNETPVCPTLGVTTVALDEEGVQVVFRTPMVGGERFDRLEGHFVLTIDGIAGSFSVDGVFTSGNTLLEGSVRVADDELLQGLDLRDRTLHVTAVVTGCHPAGAADPTSLEGVTAAPVTYTVPVECLFVFGESDYQHTSNGDFLFKTFYTGDNTAVSHYRYLILNLSGDTLTSIDALCGSAFFSATVSTADFTALGLPAGRYTAVPVVTPAYASCPSTGQPLSFEILPVCTAFDSVVVYTDGEQYQLRAYIDLSAVEPLNPAFTIQATAGQYAGGSEWYVDASQQFIATPMTALPNQQTLLQVTASVDARCGVDLVNEGYVTLSSATVPLTIPMVCPAFYGTEDTLSGGLYKMLSHINLNGGYDYQHAHFVVNDGIDSTDVAATYTSSSQELATDGISTTQNFPWTNKTITLYPVVEVKCGLSMDSYVRITGPTITRSFVTCPSLGSVSLVSNNAQDPTLREDTLLVQVANYNTDLIHRVVFTVTKIGSSTEFTWEADGWSAARGAAYKVLPLALLQQLGLSTSNLVASVDVLMEVNANYAGCSNAALYDKLVTFAPLPECPAFAGAAVTTVSQDYDGNITVATPLVHYNPLLIHHTGVAGQDSLFYTLYINTAGTAQQGSEAGTIDAVYDVQNMVMTCSIPYHQVVPGARYDFVPRIHLSSYCDSQSGAYATIEGPSGSLVSAVYCPAYTATTNAVRNADGSVTVTHQLLNFTPSLINPQGNHRVRVVDLSGNQKFSYSSNIEIDDNGLFTCTIPASSFEAYTSQSLKFRPQIYVLNPPCSSLGIGPASDTVCFPYSTLPSFTGVSNTQGSESAKTTLFLNEGIILKSKIANHSTYSGQIAQAGYLISRNPITEYSADKAVLGTIGGLTGDSLTYKVGLDSCGGVTYYRPFLIMKGCDPQVVLGQQKSFTMWAPDLTVSANPASVASGGSVALEAVATMTVGQWNMNTSNGVPCQMIPYFTENCGLNYTEDCTTTKNMEVWMYLLIGLRNCSSFWSSFSGMIINYMGMDPGIADFRYRWERNGTPFFSTNAPSDPGTTTDTPTATTTYTGVADFSYNGVHCIQKQSVTVTVP